MDFKKEEVSTGVNVEKRKFTWRITNFDRIRHSDEFIRAQIFYFKAGGSIGLETEWKAFFWITVDKKTEGGSGDESVNWIGIFLKCTKRPVGVNQVFGVAQFSIVSTNNPPFRIVGSLEPKTMIDYAVKSNWGCPKFIQKDGNSEDVIPLIDGCLVVELQFHLYAPAPLPMTSTALTTPQETDGTGSVEKQFEPMFMKKLQTDLGSLLNCSSQTSDVKVKIVSKDKKEFAVNGGILSVRSPVFGKMLEAKMKTKARTRVISIDDLSSKTITVLLRFIYTGTLHEDWSSPDVIVQLVHSAGKYQLPDLLEFLDNVLGKVCSKETAGQLLNLADKLGMKKAAQEIAKRIKKNFSNPDDMLALLGLGSALDFS